MDHHYHDCTTLHVDADGFFASVEQALNPALRGRPVVTGAERGIIAAASYEAKALGIKRGLQLHEARAICPSLVVLPSDYEAYSLYSHRLFNLLRRFTPLVEEYSIDEAFASLEGCGAALACPLEEVARRLRHTVKAELGLTVSVGISLTKTLAKLCSKFRKPDGQTILRRQHLPLMLARTPIDQVWGIGPASTAKLTNLGIKTAHDFIQLEPSRVLQILHKPGWEIWHELQGRPLFGIDTTAKTLYDSMMKGHTFAPPSANRDFIYAEALNNLLAAFAKLRRHRHLANELGLSLRHKDYSRDSALLPLPMATSHDTEAIPLLRLLFNRLHRHGHLYRSTTVWLGKLEPQIGRQLRLFEETPRRRQYAALHSAVDSLNRRYGQATVKPATLLARQDKPQHSRDQPPPRYHTLMTGESRLHLRLPRLTLTTLQTPRKP